MVWRWLWLLILLAGVLFGCTNAVGQDRESKETEPKTPLTRQEQLGFAPYSGPVPVLMYHHLAPAKDDDPTNPAIVTVESFRQQMDYLKESGYVTVTLREYADYLYGKAGLPQKPVVITFDDGYASNFQYAWPILDERGMKAVVFVVTNWLSEEDLPFDPKKADLASWRQLRMMVDSGVFEVQSHTFDAHRRVDDGYALTRPQLKENGERETAWEFRERVRADCLEARKTIEDYLGAPVFAIAFPWGGYTEETLTLVRETGYSVALTTVQGINEPGADPLTLKRRGIINGDTLERFQQKLVGR